MMWKNLNNQNTRKCDETPCKCINCSTQNRLGSKANRKLPNNDSEETDWCAEYKSRPRYDIILRNKRAIKNMSKRQHELKLLGESTQSIRMFPTVRKKTKRKKKKVQKSSLLNVLKDDKDCACEIMARAVQGNVYKHMGLSERRDNINYGPPSPDPEDTILPPIKTQTK